MKANVLFFFWFSLFREEIICQNNLLVRNTKLLNFMQNNILAEFKLGTLYIHIKYLIGKLVFMTNNSKNWISQALYKTFNHNILPS